MHKIVVIGGHRKAVLQVRVTVEYFRNVVVELTLAFNVDHDAGFSTRRDQHLSRLTLRVPITLDDDAADRGLVSHQILRILQRLDRHVEV